MALPAWKARSAACWKSILNSESLSTYAVIDFETTGLSPAHGARPTEIAVVLVRGNRIIDRYQSLMNPEMPIPYFIQAMTGITDEMVRQAPPVRHVMANAVEFANGCPIVAHNASFDRKFWDQASPGGTFICSLLLARLLFPDTPNHKLTTLVTALGLPAAASYHRALADAECTAHLFIRLQQEISQRYGIHAIECALLQKMQVSNRNRLEKCIRNHCAEA